jgi:2-isopropylmalate synthase
MDPARKLRMFEMLVRIGFKEIEVGFPSASQADFDFVRLLIDERADPRRRDHPGADAGARPLIQRTFEALMGAPRAIVHLYNATAPVMRRVVLGLDEDGIVELACAMRAGAGLAAAQPGTRWTFQYSPEMFSGTELAFSKRVVDAVTEVWQPTPSSKCIINLPSTVEHSTPNIFADMIEWMHRHLARRDSIVLSVHPHNDRGTGTAAGEFALMAGADRVEGCLFGNGERTGNVDLVNIALNLYTQGVAPGLDFSTSTRSAAASSTATSCRCTRATRTWATWSTPRSRARTRTRSRRRLPRGATATSGTCPTCRSTRRTWAAATRR